MDARKLSFGLGVFSLALGAAELLGARRIARTLDADGHEGLVRAFGAREVAAGVGLLQAPAHSARMWNRVVGDAMDLTALSLAAAKSPRNRAIWGAVAFVVGATALDTITALGLEANGSKTLPARLGRGGTAGTDDTSTAGA
ncbi:MULTISPECIES: hypothetical protein [Sphingomonas]|uniref:hypothetical protein n=1 Tax=Sphingomonas TaxID=13687 RepID=UPI000F7F9E49|nr:hypothetical protein [Sphingomonas sp. ABOLF]RSV15243.1 hypothetical protein CA235_09960 [Sphingomonas sp. ABOLF]GLK19715.1 hypothetical protein GCM10017606_05410 [Microbacterium terregens]